MLYISRTRGKSTPAYYEAWLSQFTEAGKTVMLGYSTMLFSWLSFGEVVLLDPDEKETEKISIVYELIARELERRLDAMTDLYAQQEIEEPLDSNRYVELYEQGHITGRQDIEELCAAVECEPDSVEENFISMSYLGALQNAEMYLQELKNVRGEALR